ncbi:TolC family protein [Puniceicoccaceae bacterium K14]|nr:TolC family protein [Puniceicoccaceae bacterium K14]
MIDFVRRRVTACFLLFIVSVCAVNADPSLVERLPENKMPGLVRILESAILHSNDVRDRKLKERESYGVVEVGKSLLGPNLDVYAAYRGEDEVSDLGSDWQNRTIADVSLEQPIFHWGALAAELEFRELSYQAELDMSKLTVRNLSKAVRAKILDLAVRFIELRKEEEALELRRKDLNLQQKRYESGLVSNDRMELIELQFSQVEIGVNRRKMNLDFTVEDIARAYGLEANELVALLPKSIPKPDYLNDEDFQLLESLVDTAIGANEGIRNFKAALEMERLSLKKVKKRHLPKLDFATGITQNERDIDGRVREEQLLYAGLVVNWNIFDGRETSGIKMSTLSRVQQRENAYRETKEAVARNYKRSIMRLRSSLKNLQIQETYLERSGKEYEQVAQNYELEKVSENELKKASEVLLAKDTQTQRARVSYINDLVSLVSDLGFDPYVKRYASSQDVRLSNKYSGN